MKRKNLCFVASAGLFSFSRACRRVGFVVYFAQNSYKERCLELVAGVFSILFAPILGETFAPIIGEVTLLGVLALIVGLIILWIIVSIPVYIAAKIVTAGESTLSDAMFATLFGPTIYAVTMFLVDYFLGALIGSGAYIWALILAFIAWIWVFKASFKTGWLKALAIALLAILVFAAISMLFGAVLGLVVPAPFFPKF